MKIATLRPVQGPDGVHLPSPLGGIPSPLGDRLVVLTALEVPGWKGASERGVVLAIRL